MVFVDFDDTIFNTKKFKRDYISLFEKEGITKREFDDSYYLDGIKRENEEMIRMYDVDAQLKKLESVKGRDLKGLASQIDRFMKDTQKYVFEDFYKFVGNFSNDQLILISFGSRSFQTRKIRSSGVLNYFSKIVVTGGSKSEYVNDIVKEREKEKIIFLDDRCDQITNVVQCVRSIVPIRIKRKEGRYSSVKTPKTIRYEACSLDEALKIMKKI
ncbi:MAG: HAD hydrolase-like protein [Patescibacteria group bacterium]|nr:HAD hydrolase-like protein [Patescibacteria group bacterium]